MPNQESDEQTKTWPGSPRGIHAHIERVEKKLDALRATVERHVRIERVARWAQAAQAAGVVTALVVSGAALYIATSNRAAIDDQSSRVTQALDDLRMELRSASRQVVIVPGGCREDS